MPVFVLLLCISCLFISVSKKDVSRTLKCASFSVSHYNYYCPQGGTSFHPIITKNFSKRWSTLSVWEKKKKKATPPDETHPWRNVGRRLITGADKKLVQIQNRPRDDQLTAALKTFNPVIKSRWQNCRITCTNIQGSVFFKACTHTHKTRQTNTHLKCKKTEKQTNQ